MQHPLARNARYVLLATERVTVKAATIKEVIKKGTDSTKLIFRFVGERPRFPFCTHLSRLSRTLAVAVVAVVGDTPRCVL